jgi:hypothetical protein
MDIYTAAQYMKHGYRVRRQIEIYTIDSTIDPPVKVPFTKVVEMGENTFQLFSLEDLLATDWELITDGIVSYFPITYSS